MKEKKEVLVLFSGGIDSTSCIFYYKSLGYNVHGLFINYGQKAEKLERIAVTKISSLLSIKLRIIETNITPIIDNYVIQGRNYLLLSQALISLPFSKGIVSLGIHSGTNFPDCSREFVTKNQAIFDMYTNGNIIIDCPFIEMQKDQIFQYFKKNDFPIEFTYSCENGGEVPCGICSSCLDLKKLNNESKN